jgi:hypothetical protein
VSRFVMAASTWWSSCRRSVGAAGSNGCPPMTAASSD